MSKKQKQSAPRTLAEVAMNRVGIVKAIQVLTFVACWWIALERLGVEEMLPDDFAEYWAVSRAQSFRKQALFRRTFPEFTTPTELRTALSESVELPPITGNVEQDTASLVSLPMCA